MAASVVGTWKQGGTISQNRRGVTGSIVSNEVAASVLFFLLFLLFIETKDTSRADNGRVLYCIDDGPHYGNVNAVFLRNLFVTDNLCHMIFIRIVVLSDSSLKICQQRC